MIIILADHNIEGHALALWDTLSAAGWLELVPLRMVTFVQADLPPESSDREGRTHHRPGQFVGRKTKLYRNSSCAFGLEERAVLAPVMP